MVFTKRLRDGVRRGEITCSVRIRMSPRVKVGNRYPMEEGEIEIDSITSIGFPDSRVLEAVIGHTFEHETPALLVDKFGYCAGDRRATRRHLSIGGLAPTGL